MRFNCAVCNSFMTAVHSGWYERWIPHVCSSACFQRLVLEGNISYDPLADERVVVFKHSDRSFRSDYERDFNAWTKKVKMPHEYERYLFKLSDKSRYVPDFFLAGRVLVEVKGLWTPAARKKFTLFTREFEELPIVVLDKQFLTMLKKTAKAEANG